MDLWDPFWEEAEVETGYDSLAGASAAWLAMLSLSALGSLLILWATSPDIRGAGKLLRNHGLTESPAHPPADASLAAAARAAAVGVGTTPKSSYPGPLTLSGMMDRCSATQLFA